MEGKTGVEADGDLDRNTDPVDLSDPAHQMISLLKKKLMMKYPTIEMRGKIRRAYDTEVVSRS